MKTIKQANLFYQEGGSDKVYHVQLVETATDEYDVAFQYGRRGAALASGFKSRGENLVSAEKAYNKILNEKLGKGYEYAGGVAPAFTPTATAAVSSNPAAKEKSDFSVQLLNEIDEKDADKYINSDSWGMQEKYDGRRMAVSKIGGKLKATNKKGIYVDAVPQEVADLLERVAVDIIVDGELVGNTYCIFDIINYNGIDLRNLTASDRHKQLSAIQALSKNVVSFHFTSTDKREAFDNFRKNKKEGAVFKHLAGKYVAGRPASGGTQLKCKFWDSATVLVTSHTKDKSSIGVSVYDGSKLVTVGSVTIPPNKAKPAIGAIVEVVYLYYNPGGALYQTEYIGVRDDQDATDCLLTKLKAKGTVSEDIES